MFSRRHLLGEWPRRPLTHFPSGDLCGTGLAPAFVCIIYIEASASYCTERCLVFLGNQDWEMVRVVPPIETHKALCVCWLTRQPDKNPECSLVHLWDSGVVEYIPQRWHYLSDGRNIYQYSVGLFVFFFFESHLGDVCSDFQNIFRISEMLSGFCRDLRTVFIVRVNWNPNCLSICLQVAMATCMVVHILWSGVRSLIHFCKIQLHIHLRASGILFLK